MTAPQSESLAVCARALAGRCAELLIEELPLVESIALFGSVARGEVRATSDLDLLVVLRDPPRRYSERVELILPILKRLRQTPEYDHLVQRGCYCEPAFVLLSVEELTEHPALLIDCVEDAVVLYDPHETFRRELDVVRTRMRAYGATRHRLPDGSWYWVIKPDLQPGELIEL